MGSWLYEGVLAIAVIAIPSLLYSVLAQARHALDHRHGLQIVVFAVLALYFVTCWSRGQTLPMRTWRMRLVDRVTGRPPAWPRALLRYLLCWLWFLPPLAALAPLREAPEAELAAMVAWVVLWAALSRLRRDRQFLHDVWAGTRIVSAGASRTERAIPPDHVGVP